MYGHQWDILVGLLKEIRDRLPQPVSDLTTSDEAATQKFPAYLPDLVPYTIEHPINGTQVETRRAYVDINGHIRFLPAGFPPGSSWRALWIERETR